MAVYGRIRARTMILAAGAALACWPVTATAQTPSQISGQDAVQIGEQVWMSRNLAVRTFRNGDPVPEIPDTREWAEAGQQNQPGFSLYENDIANDKRWGLLYNYAAIVDPRGLCPIGWRVPSNSDWDELEQALGAGDGAAISLKAGSGWPAGSNGSNASGFAALPAGFRTQVGAFFLAERVAYFWSSTQAADRSVTAHMLFDYEAPLFRIAYDPAMGMSLRCIAE